MSDKKPHTFRKIAVGSAIAGAAGYIAGVLSAPKSGKQTRDDITNKAEELKDTAEFQLQDLNDELKDLIKNSKDKAVGLGTTARAEYNEALIRAKDAQNKTGQLLKAIKTGEAEDPELSKALRQAKQAAKNLGRYYKN